MELLKSSRRLKVSSDFYGIDSKELLEKNLKEQPLDWYWRNRPIWYDVNSQGYRCQEFDNIDWNNSTLIIGDSYVFGLGLDVASTTADILSKQTDSTVINLGQPGASPMFSWANSCILKDNNIAPKCVIYLWSWPDRITEFTPAHQKSTAINHGSNFGADWCIDWIIHDDQGFEFLKYAIISTTNLWNCKVLHYAVTYDDFDDRYSTLKNVKELSKPLDWARDWMGKQQLAHPGPNWNKNWSTAIIRDLGNIA